MNYSHAFHAGNFADVVKHAALARCLLSLSQDRTPLRIIDTHGGAGLYDLSGEAARAFRQEHGAFFSGCLALSLNAGAYISDFLQRKPNSRAATAILTKREG